MVNLRIPSDLTGLDDPRIDVLLAEVKRIASDGRLDFTLSAANQARQDRVDAMIARAK